MLRVLDSLTASVGGTAADGSPEPVAACPIHASHLQNVQRLVADCVEVDRLRRLRESAPNPLARRIARAPWPCILIILYMASVSRDSGEVLTEADQIYLAFSQASGLAATLPSVRAPRQGEWQGGYVGSRFALADAVQYVSAARNGWPLSVAP